MAFLLKIYQGSAQYIWENYDAVFINALVDETTKIEEKINKEAGIGDNKISRSGNSIDPSGGLSFTGLLDLPSTPESEEKVRKMVEKMEAKKRKKKR